MTQERLNYIQADTNAASAGPWKTFAPSKTGESENVWEAVIDLPTGVYVYRVLARTLAVAANDSSFIAMSRTAIPELLAEVERLRGEVHRREVALCSLTPGGSEFSNDPDGCVQWVRAARNNQHELIVKLIKEARSSMSIAGNVPHLQPAGNVMMHNEKERQKP
jgi:hypothetical protein